MLLSYSSPVNDRGRQPPAGTKQVCYGIAGVVADEFGLPAVAIKSATRGAPRAAYARQVTMYLAHVCFALSFETIGRAFDRDRTTVAHACRVVEDSRDDAGLDRCVAKLERMCSEARSECFQGGSDAGV